MPASAGSAPPTPAAFAGVLRLALREARFSHDAHPSEIIVAQGRLVDAEKVFDPEGGMAPAGLESFGGANSRVYVVVMHGAFVWNGSRPYTDVHTPVPREHVLELLIDANEQVEGRSMGDRVEVPLARLGHVTRLR